MFRIYQDSAREYRWQFKAANGEIIADSGEGYSSRYACELAIVNYENCVRHVIWLT